MKQQFDEIWPEMTKNFYCRLGEKEHFASLDIMKPVLLKTGFRAM